MPRRLLAEFVGSALLVAIIVGSGVAAQELSPDNLGLQLLENSTATALGLAVLILLFGPVSGAHFNPVISGVDWLLGRKTGSGVSFRTLSGFAVAQTAGAVTGAMLANIMFDRRIVEFSTKDRISFGIWLAKW